MFNLTNTSPITTSSFNSQRSFHSELSRLKQRKDLLTILVLLFVCAFAWAIVSVFSAQKKSTISPDLVKLSKPLSPLLDTAVLDTLEGRRQFSDDELVNFPIYKIYTNSTTQKESIVPIDFVEPTKATPTPRPKTSPSPSPTTTTIVQ